MSIWKCLEWLGLLLAAGVLYKVWKDSLKGKKKNEKKADDIQIQPPQEERSRDINTIYEEKNQMEREISRIVAGDTGLAEVLKRLKDEAEKRDGKGFLFYAWTYRRKTAELEKIIEKAKQRHVYELLTPKEQTFYALLLHVVNIMDRFDMLDTENVSEEALGQWYDAVKKEEENGKLVDKMM